MLAAAVGGSASLEPGFGAATRVIGRPVDDSMLMPLGSHAALRFRGGDPTSTAACPYFVNADLIAAGLSPFVPAAAAIKAGKLMLQEIKGYAARRESFAFETTLSGLGYLRHIKDWRASGYHVMLFFLTLPSIEMAIARVAERVSQGGHDIPEAVIRRRFVTGVRNFYAHYRDAVNAWAVYDNSGEKPVLTHWSENL